MRTLSPNPGRPGKQGLMKAAASRRTPNGPYGAQTTSLIPAAVQA
jgi:hypothetical protein